MVYTVPSFSFFTFTLLSFLKSDLLTGIEYLHILKVALVKKMTPSQVIA